MFVGTTIPNNNPGLFTNPYTTPLHSLFFILLYVCSLRPLPAVKATTRTLHVWLLSNLGGTGWLLVNFCRDSPANCSVALAIGAVAALVSLACVPLITPFFALANRFCISWFCRTTAGVGAVVAFFLTNYLFLKFLPLGPLGSLLSVSGPYLCAALLAVAWIYRPAMAPARARHGLQLG
ncbi:MAG: hypothetical protein ACRYFR_05300 [Janthinobacterium lividum]